MTDADRLGLKPCPFCGSREAVQLWDGQDENQTMSLIEDPLAKIAGFRFSIICNLHLGGCGGESGVRRDPDQAIAAWNDRARPHLSSVS